MNVKIHDSNQMIKFCCEELRAIQSVIQVAEEHTEYANEHETLIVVRRALEPIIGDIEEAYNAIDEELEHEGKDQHPRPADPPADPRKRISTPGLLIQKGGKDD